ncbi:hypothetical protein B0J13DRAFT_190199 [Dactylonectria estremocensis]|uniref:Uncharacterized protein n=1 Tax=Dactylonectria estremocensis TaxID=1079267 RepID=A0A9P9FD46_9HYPO|nr:hypothetical protein B0J13DRAFT_190199 [Dactylonectria estremocensis]
MIHRRDEVHRRPKPSHDSTGLPPLKFPMATQPVPHNQRAPLPPPSGLAMMGGNDQVRPQATNDHLMAPSAYPTQPMVQSAYEPFDAVQPNSGLPLELDCQPRVTHISSRQQSLDVSRASSVSVGLQINRTERNEPHWPHNNGLPRNGNFNAVPPIVDRGTGRNGTRAARGNRRGGYNQRNATVQVTQQHQGDQRPTHNKRDGTPYSVNTFRRQTVGHQPPNPFPCRNSNSGLNGIEYLHCTCDDCNQRNRSVHVLVKGATPNQQLLDLQTRIKFGLGERFGKVDAVFPVPSKDFAMFIVRFSLEYSVSEALVAGGGDMAEIGISVTISPVVRSKWINRPHGGVAPTNGSRDLALQHPPLSSPIATNQPHSMSYLDAAGVSHAAHSTQNLGLPVHLPHVQIIRGEYSGQPYVSAGHFPHAAFARTSFSNPTYHAGQHLPSREQAQNQGRRMSSSHRETSFGSRASLLKKVEVPQPKASKGKENGGGKEQAKGSAQAKECKPSKAKHTMSSKTTETSSNETGSCCADQIVLGDGKVNDRQLEAANNAPPEESLPTLAADSIPGVHREDHNSPSRVPSIFTDQEIKERRKAWARISMPIGPRKVKTCPTSANDIMETKESASKSALDGKSIIASERSLPSQSSIFMPDTGSTPELSPNRGSAASSLTQKGISFSGRLCDETTAKTLQSKPTKGPSVMHSKHKQGTSGRESRQSDRSGQDSSFSTPTSPHLHMAATKPSELHRGHQARSGSDQPQPGEGPRKSRKNKNKKKAKQGEHSQQASTTPSNPAMAQAGRSKESPQQPGTPSQGVQNTAKAVSKETCSQKTISEVRPLSPGKRYREDSTQRCGSTSAKRTKPDGDEDSSVKGSRPPTPNDPHQTQVINEETRGRKGYRVGAGGSLRMGKQRRARPLLTEPSVAEQHLNTQVAPPSSDFGFECPSMAQLQGSTCMTGDTEKEKPAAPRVQSQLNPAAKDYQSPSWDLDYKPPTKAENNTAFDNAKEVSLPQPQKADNARQESPAESTPTEDKKEPTLLNDAAPTDSASPGTRKPSKSPKLDKGKSKGKGKGKGKGKTAPDEDKTVVAKNMKAPVEDKAAPTEDKATPTKKKAEEPHTPNRASAQRKANLDNDHWPSLPPPRDRAASKSSTPSLWGAKKTGGSSRQSSPGNK